MLLTEKPQLSPFQIDLNVLSMHIKSLIKHPSLIEYDYIYEDFYREYQEFIFEFYAAIDKRNLVYATKIVDQLYLKWIDSTVFPENIRAAVDYAISAVLTSMVTTYLAVELAHASHYSLFTTYGLTLLAVHVGVKVTTPAWVSVGTLSGGLFKCKVIKSRTLTKNTRRMLRS